MTLPAAVEPARTAEGSRSLDLGPLSALAGQVLVTGAASQVSQVITRLLNQLTAAGIPWLRVGRLPARGVDSRAFTVVDLMDPHGVPLTIDPFSPEPGYPPAAHAEALSGLLAAAFDLPASFRDVLVLALDRLDAARGAHESAPTTRQLERAVVAVARELGRPESVQSALRGFIGVRLGGLRGLGTGLLLGGGHPVDTAELLSRNVDLVTGNVGGAEGRALLSGAVALRVAEHACRQSPTAAGDLPRHVMVLEEAGLLFSDPRAVGQVTRLFRDAAAHGAGAIITERAPVPGAPWPAGAVALTTAYVPAAQGPASVSAAPYARSPQVRDTIEQRISAPNPSDVARLAAFRATSCGRSCRTERPCARGEIATATALADARDQEAAWLRVWVTALLLAFLTGRPLPVASAPLRAARARGRRVMECALAIAVDHAVAERASALRTCFPPAALARALALVAADLLYDGPRPATAGHVWVIPQLRWAHEATRVGWARVPAPPAAIRPGDLAPPLDFALAGLPDWTGIVAADRLGLLLRHPLSLEAAANRDIAAAALFGECGQVEFETTLAADVTLALPPPSSYGTIPLDSSLPPDLSCLSEATRLMGSEADWLVPVLWWTRSG